MTEAAHSILDQYQSTSLDALVSQEEEPPRPHTGVHRHERLRLANGGGQLEHLCFANGLLTGRSDYRLEQAHTGSYQDTETVFGAGLLLAGHFDLEIRDLRLRERISTDRIWIRSGHFPSMHYSQPPGERLQSIAIDVSDNLLESWREESPKSINASVRRALRRSGPTFEALPGTGRSARLIARRMLHLDTADLCERLEFESLALDLLVRLLRADDGSEPGLTAAERRERRLRIALEEARDILDSDLTATPTIAELARRVGLNECYLKTGFRQRFGSTIGVYARAQRLEHARRLIEREGHGVQEAAQAVGYSSLGWFSSCFQSHFGYRPSHLGRRPRH